ncbi:MAG: 2-C-methyl-D-erythritol 4-phosphate cytidylyltransferase [Sedimenticola sp.]|nr:2-C-methyl-D-erythritol 4-phosphate cytidylyltransferase [Sedimenticola sp.]
MSSAINIWAVVPAAGIGSRMGAEIPKQYLELNGRTVIETALQTLLDHPAIAKVVVAVADTDSWWESLDLAGHNKVTRVSGGAQRADSVLNGLRSLHDQAMDSDWVLVHDAARPCLHRGDLDRLINTLYEHPVGGLLACPLSDTIKRVDSQGTVVGTLPREQLWRAFTPQMFRYGILRSALEQAALQSLSVTDEASAVELSGAAPQIIEGRSDNIKITRPEDLELALFYLSQQGLPVIN